MKRGHFAVVVCLCLVLAGVRAYSQSSAPNSSPQNWKQRPVTIRMKPCSLEEQLAQFSRQSGKSVLVEGIPLTASAEANMQDTAEAQLNRLANAFDYTWQESKLGVVLFRKRFLSPDERPQLCRPELHAYLSRAMAVLGSAPVPFLKTDTITPAFAQLADSFSEDQKLVLFQGNRLITKELPEAQRNLVRQAIYTRLFGVIYAEYALLDDCLVNFDSAELRNLGSPGTNKEGSPRVGAVLAYTAMGNSKPVSRILAYGSSIESSPVDDTDSSSGRAMLERTVQRSAGQPDRVDLLTGVTDVRELCGLLRTVSASDFVVTPELNERKVVALFYRATPDQVLQALGEMFGLSVDRQDNTIRVRFPAAGGARDLGELAHAVSSLMPPDLRRYISADRLSTPEGAWYRIPGELAPYRSYRNGRIFGAKMQKSMDALKTAFVNSVSPAWRQSPIAVKSLPGDQQDRLTRFFVSWALYKITDSLTRCFNRPTTYETDPDNAYIVIDGGNLLIGGEITEQQQGGAFGTAYPPRTLTLPGK